MATFTEFRIFYGEYCFTTFAENVDKALEYMQTDLKLVELPVIDSIKQSIEGKGWQTVKINRQAITN